MRPPDRLVWPRISGTAPRDPTIQPMTSVLDYDRRYAPFGLGGEEHINRLRLPGQLHDLPVSPYGIEQAQYTIEFPKMNLRQHFRRELDVRVTGSAARRIGSARNPLPHPRQLGFRTALELY
jgi:hypothetical protein